MDYVYKVIQWAENFISSGGKIVQWLTTPFEIPQWLRVFGYIFVPFHFMNLLIEHFAMSPLEFLSISSLISLVGITIFQWIIK